MNGVRNAERYSIRFGCFQTINYVIRVGGMWIGAWIFLISFVSSLHTMVPPIFCLSSCMPDAICRSVVDSTLEVNPRPWE